MRDFSYQLYSSRKFPPLADTLAMLGNLGYSQVEGFGGLYGPGADVGALRAGLDENGLSMPTAHFGLPTVRDTPDEVIATAKALGIKVVLVPHIAAPDRPADAAGWAAFGRELVEAGKPIRDAGFAYGWHNHEFEFTDLGGDDLPLDLMLGDNDLALELDLAWVEVGGQSAVDYINKYADRIVSVHLKDIAPEGECLDEDGWADVGFGIMDWPAIMAAVDKSSAQYLVMEHDNPNDHQRFASRSLSAAKEF